MMANNNKQWNRPNLPQGRGADVKADYILL